MLPRSECRSLSLVSLTHVSVLASGVFMPFIRSFVFCLNLRESQSFEVACVEAGWFSGLFLVSCCFMHSRQWKEESSSVLLLQFLFTFSLC